GVVGHPGVLGRGPAGGAAGGRVHVPVRVRDEEGPVPAATDAERLLEPVELLPGTLGLLLGCFGLAQRTTDPGACRLGCRPAIGKGHPFTGRGQHLPVALAPGAASLPAVADRPVQRGETTPLPGQGRRKLRRRLPCVLIEGDRIRGAHIEPELLDQPCPGRILLPGLDLHVSFFAKDRSELAPVALLAGIPLPHDARHHRSPSVDGCSPGEVGGAPRRRDATSKTPLPSTPPPAPCPVERRGRPLALGTTL